MTNPGDNDDTFIIWASGDDGKTLSCVGWDEARERLRTFMKEVPPGESITHEDLLCALFTGRTIDAAAISAVREHAGALERLAER